MTLTQSRFRAEADMLEPISDHAARLGIPGAICMYEVQSAAGVPDISLVQFDASAVAVRERVGFLEDVAGLAAVHALSDAPDLYASAHQIAEAAGFSVRYLSSTVLPSLAERGWLESDGFPGRWHLRERFTSTALRLVTVEAKLRDWRRALGQAVRHAAGADAAWVVLDIASVGAADAFAFDACGIGLAGLDLRGGLTVVVEPRTGHVYRNRRDLLAERCGALYARGANSGAIGQVFGRHLRSTTGPDPRLASA